MYRRFRTAENQEKREKAKAKEIVGACWELVEEQCKNNENVRTRNSSEEAAESPVSPWRIVRVFVSSTFTDFFCEREVLVKKVFPELREWCEERNIRLVECDLRWGVPKDTDSAETIQCCLEELDRCHAETNRSPFFINLLGERYGWIPERKDLGNDLKDLYMWVPNTSITFMEILHGAYRSCNPNAVFFIRNSDVINDIPEDFQKRFIDKEILNKCHLKELKKQLKIKFPNQVFDYDCKYSGMSEKAGRKRVMLEGLDTFAEKTLTFFKSRISQFYPDSNTTNTENDKGLEDQEQIHFLERKAHFVVGQDELIDKLLAYAKGQDPIQNKIEGEQTAFVRDPEFWKCEDGDNLMVCLSGEVGQGKTSLLAKLVKRALKVGLKVFYHFVGISENSVQKNILLKRLAEFIKGEQIDIPDDTSDVTEFSMKVIKEEFTKLRQKENQILIVLDGMNELADRDQYKHLSWLPPRFPGNIRAIVSTSSDHLPTLHRLKEHTCFLINIPQLKKSEAKEIIAQYLIMFNKKLDNDQMDIILSKPSSLNPLWLTLLAEQLRTFGDFRTLNQHIQSLSDSVDGLLEGVLRDLVANDDSGKMEKALSILALTQGLPEIDMQNILGDMDIQEPIPALYWSKIRRALKPFTYMAGVDRNIRFIHGAFYENIEKLYLSEKKSQIMYHTVIVDYLMSWCSNNVVKRLKVPFHCQRAELYDKLVDFIHHSESATVLGDYMRSMYLQSARCMQIADPVLKVTMQVVLCRGCSNAYRGFKAKHFPLNKDACVICGTHIFGHKVSEAYLCLRHSQGQSKLLGKCRLCDMAIRKDENGKIADFMGCPGKLCMHCSGGIGAKRCSYIGKRK